MTRFFRQRLITILIVLGSVGLFAILYFSYRHTRDLFDASAWVEHTHEVLLESDKLAMDVKNIQVNGRVYLVTKDESMFDIVAGNERSAQERIRQLRRLVKDNPSQVKKVDSLNALLHKRTNLSSLLSVRPDILPLFVESKAYEDLFIKTLSEFQSEEYRLLGVRKDRSARSVFVFKSFLIGLIIVFALLLALILISVNNSERLRRRVTDQNSTLLKSLRETMDYKYALDESSIVAITDHRGIIKHVNDYFCRISKYKREELIGRDHRIINSGYHSKQFFANLWSTIASGKVWKGEIRNRAKDGSFYWVDTSIIPFINESGKPYQYLAIRSDISERVQADEIKATNRRLGFEIQEKNAQLVALLDRITDGFVTFDKELRYTSVNRKAAELAHASSEAMIGRKIVEVFPDALDSPTHLALLEALEKQHYVVEMDYYPPLDLWYETHIYPTSEGLSVFIRDVTKQMRAEQKQLEAARTYRMIASSIPGSVICIVDQEYTYTLIEGDMIDRLGYSKQGLFGKKAKDVLTKERYDEIRPYFDRAFNGDTFSVEVRRGDYDLLTRYVPLPDEHGQITSIMIASIDVTAIKDAERRVAELNIGLERKIVERTAQLEFANKELESFSYSVAHDLRAPLRAVSGYTAMLREDYGKKLDEEGIRLLSEIEYNGNRMSTLIDDLLKFSKLGRKEVRKSVVDMKELISDVVKKMPVGNARIIFGKLHPVFGDMSLLRHVIENLLSNAVKYSSRKSDPEVTIASVMNHDIVTYSITDNGVGFDMKYVEGLFGVFKRLHTNEDFEGTGVGLAIVQRIIQRHGGKIWPHARVNEGATFFFTLPAIPSDQI